VIGKESKIYVAGHSGMVGSALVERLQSQGYANIITRTHSELDLTDQAGVLSFLQAEQPDCVYLAAAKVGGIHANSTYPAEFIQTNLAIQNSVIHASYLVGVSRLMFFGSTCTFPNDCPQPMREEDSGTGNLEPTSEPYATAKLAGMKMIEAYNRQYGTYYTSLIPATLYGPNDNFDSETSHVMSALIGRIHDAKASGQDSVVIWGTGTPRREFLYIDDLADACIFLMGLPDEQLKQAFEPKGWVLNAGVGDDLTILELALAIKQAVGFTGEVLTDPSRPDGAPRKLLNSHRINELGWSPNISLEEGIAMTYAWYLKSRIKTPV